ncbi:hypothetical protein [Streptomyces sp. NPDC049879]|uniref:hypothetical protein n=1 Tax=Streptomyces sp. NPDC049879 TaxID=3365598 RepID=UPI00378F37F3
MAGRCGCGGTCACELTADPPLKVTGTGTPLVNPWKLSLELDGKTGCDALTACVANNLGPGLTYDAGSGKIQVKLSTDDGQVARFGGDEGLLVTNGTGPTPETCTRGIGSLPPAPNVVAAQDLAGLVGPYSSPYQVDYCLGEGFDMVLFHCGTSSDDVGVVSDYWDMKISAGRSSLYIAQDARQMTAATIQSTFNYAGDVDDPVSYNPGDDLTIAQRKDRRGGWYGNLAQRYYQPLASDFMRKINGKAVAVLDCSLDPNSNEYPESAMIVGAQRSVLENCAQDWSMIGVAQVDNAVTIKNRGITPILIPIRPSTWASTTLPYPVADLTAAGIEWIALSDRWADSVFTAYKDAGLQVMMRGNSRQSQYDRVAALGIRGAFQYDPSYYRGPGTRPELWPHGYRTEYDPWEHRRFGTGQLTWQTDQQSVLSSGGFIRGRCEANEQGLIIPANFGGGRGRPGILCGWRCPMTDPTAYTITWDMKWNTLATGSATTAKCGILFGALTDRDTYDWPDDTALNPVGYPEGQKTLYRAYQRQNGELGIAKWASQTGAIQYLATATSPAIAANVYNSYQVTVTPTQITFERTASNGTKYTVTAADSQYRGGYFWVEKEETGGTGSNPFEAKFRNVQYTPTS